MKRILTTLLLLPSLVLAAKNIKLTEKNTINFNQAFSDGFVSKKQIEAIDLCNSNPKTDIFVVLNTPGGSVSAGQLLYDTLHALPCFFHTITIFSASMGYQTVQNLGQRYIIPSGVLMSHRAKLGGLGGEIGGELDSILNFYKKSIEEMEIIAANRVGISLEKYRDEIKDELWMTAEQSVEKGHADAIVLVNCDKSLLGSYTETMNTFFGQLLVEFSKCPLITAPLSVRGNNNIDLVKLNQYIQSLFKNIITTL